MPRTSKTEKVQVGQEYYVSVEGDPANDGSMANPWSLDYALLGAGTRLQPGDTVFVRGGTYRDQKGYNVRVSGAAGQPISFKAYPGETVILDGSIPEFTIGNLAWERRLSVPMVYCSKQPVAGFYGGFIELDGRLYSLAPHPDLSYLMSMEDSYDETQPRYLGPGLVQNKADGYLYIRLDNSSSIAQLDRPVPQITDPDPNNNVLHIGNSDSFGLRITGSHLVFEDFARIDYYGGCFRMGGLDQTDLTFRNCGGRPIYFGVRCAFVNGLILDSCKFEAHMPGDTWWVSYFDIKGTNAPADNVRKVGLDLGQAKNVQVINCVLDEFFDGILSQASHDVEIQRTVFNHIWDDAWQMNGRLYRINFHHNFCYGAGPSVDGQGLVDANLDPGTIYIHHNVIDTTTRLQFWGRCAAPSQGMFEAIPLSSHGGEPEDIFYTLPRKIYYNTIKTGQTNDPAHPYVTWALFHATADNSQAQHEVYNNIFLVLDGRPGGRDFNAFSSREIYDGNVYWHYREDSPSKIKSPWHLLYISTQEKPLNNAYLTVEELRASQAFKDSQVYYAPGWESVGLSEDPELDSRYRPRADSCRRGAVRLTKTGWPGTSRYEAWRGAVRPVPGHMTEPNSHHGDHHE